MSNVSAECSESQIDINSASLEELDKLSGIGPVKAQAIIDARNFNSVDDLIDVNGIGEVTLSGIKEQGLACVQNEVDNEEFEIEESSDEDEEEDKKEKESEETEEESIEIESSDDKTRENANLKPIILNAQSIKSENDKEFSTENLALFGVILFCVVFGVLLFVRKRKYKNEFQ